MKTETHAEYVDSLNAANKTESDLLATAQRFPNVGPNEDAKTEKEVVAAVQAIGILATGQMPSTKVMASRGDGKEAKTELFVVRSTSWKIEVTTGGGEWTTNACRYTNKRGAQIAGDDLFSRWMAMTDFRVVQCDNEWPNYHIAVFIEDGKTIAVQHRLVDATEEEEFTITERILPANC